jgi:hypothetical protein
MQIFVPRGDEEMNREGDQNIREVWHLPVNFLVKDCKLDQPHNQRERPMDYCDHLWEQAVLDSAEEAQGDESVRLYFANIGVWRARDFSWRDAGKILCQDCGEPLKAQIDARNKAKSDATWDSYFGRAMGISPEKFRTLANDQAAQGKTAVTYTEMKDAVANSDIKPDETWSAHTGRQVGKAWNEAIGGPVKGSG